MRVLLVEDDGDQASEIAGELRARFGGVIVEVLPTEYDLVQRMPEIIKRPPEVILLDVMLRRTPMVQGQEIEFPLDVGFSHDAGIRCAKSLRDKGSKVPIILYSVLDPSDVADGLEKLP